MDGGIKTGDLISSVDFNRIEGNVEALDNTYNIGGTFLFDFGDVLYGNVPETFAFSRRLVHIPYENAKIILLSAYISSSNLKAGNYTSIYGDSRDDRLIANQSIRVVGTYIDNNETYEDIIGLYSLSGITSQQWTLANAPIIASVGDFYDTVVVQHETNLLNNQYENTSMSGIISTKLIIRVIPQT